MKFVDTSTNENKGQIAHIVGYRQAVRHKTLTLARDSSNLSTPTNMVDIVQLVERQIVVLVVVGSSPSIHPS